MQRYGKLPDGSGELEQGGSVWDFSMCALGSEMCLRDHEEIK